MQTTQRPLSANERMVLETNLAYNNKIIRGGYSLKTIGVTSLIAAGLVYLMFTFVESSEGFGWCFFGLVVCGFVLYSAIMGTKRDIKNARKLSQRITEALTKEKITLRHFQSKRAILFVDPEDMGDTYVLQIGENKLLIIRDLGYIYRGLLPNTKVTLYTSELSELLQTNVILTGDSFQPLVFTGGLSFETAHLLQENVKIIEGTLESVLQDLRQKMEKS